MKKHLLIVSLALTSLLNAQSLTQANEPTIGLTSSMFLCDSFATNYASTTGNTAVWDYSQIFGYPGQNRNIKTIDPSTTTNASTFSTSTKAFEIQNFITTYWTSDVNSRTSQGFVFNEPTFGEVIGNYSTNNETLMTYPFAYNSNSNDNFEGILSFNFNGFPQNPTCTGNANAMIDGQGTLKVGTTTLNNVIRYKIQDSTFATVVILGDIVFVRTQFEYYDINNPAMPVFIHTNAKILNIGSVTPIVDLSLVLSALEPAGYLGIHKTEATNFKLYPNPANESFQITGNFDSNATVTILDQAGRIVKSSMELNNITTINTSDLNQGLYLVEITNNGVKTSKKITVE